MINYLGLNKPDITILRSTNYHTYNILGGIRMSELFDNKTNDKVDARFGKCSG